jgi:hypothetical protein
MMSFLLIFILLIIIQVGLSVLLGLFGAPVFAIDIVVSFASAFLISFLTTMRGGIPFYRNERFHRNFVIIFIILLGLRYLFGYL